MSQPISVYAQKIIDLRQSLKGAFIERNEVVDGMLIALLSKQHLFLLGAPGTAKSNICEALCNSFSGNYFSWLLSKFSDPSEVFGPYSMSAMKDDRYERNTTNKLPEAQIGFLDEIFKCNSALLNTLLKVLNERSFHNGTKVMEIPLQSLFGASNEIPQGEELSALYDRFALRYEVERIQSEKEMKNLLKSGLNLSKIPQFSMQDLEKAQKEAMAIDIDDDVLDGMINIRQEIHEKGIMVSDRKWIQAMQVLKAFAYLQGKSVVDSEDLTVLENVLWHTPSQRKDIRKIIGPICNPLGDKLIELEDGINTIEEGVGKTIEPLEAVKKLKAVQDILTKYKREHPHNNRLATDLARVEKLRLEITKQALVGV